MICARTLYINKVDIDKMNVFQLAGVVSRIEYDPVAVIQTAERLIVRDLEVADLKTPAVFRIDHCGVAGPAFQDRIHAGSLCTDNQRIASGSSALQLEMPDKGFSPLEEYPVAGPIGFLAQPGHALPGVRGTQPRIGIVAAG